MDKLELVLSVDAISPPLTGIGRYTWELAAGLAHHPSVASLRFYRNSRWVEDPAALLLPSSTVKKKGWRKGISAPRRYRNWQCARIFRDRLFHSPNYFLPASTDLAVATIHDLSALKYRETLPIPRREQFDRELPLTLKRASHLITPSEAVRGEIIEHLSWPSDKVTAVPNGVASSFHPRLPGELNSSLAGYGLEAGGYALCVSTLEPRKKIDALLAAYRRLPGALRSRYPLVLVGDKGWLSEAIHDSIGKGQAEGWMRYLGFVPESDLPILYAGARAFFYPSLYEGFGLPVLEAMASGVPVLTSDRSSLPEVSNGAAMLIDPDDDDALFRGVEKALLDDVWLFHARARGLEVASHLTWENCVEQTLSVYARLVSAPC